MVNVGIQGEAGSACDAAAAELLRNKAEKYSLVYLNNAARVFDDLLSGVIESAVIAMESPVGVPITETHQAISAASSVTIISELRSEVRHSLMVNAKDQSKTKIKHIASHEVPLSKHREFLQKTFPGYYEIVVTDTGEAASQLAAGMYPPGTAVIALPRAAEIFKLDLLHHKLPANDNYLTLFAHVKLCTRDRAGEV